MKPAWQSFLTALVFGGALSTSAGSNPIRLDTVGYLPELPKVASIAADCTNFQLIRVSDGKSIFAGEASGPVTNADSGEKLFSADFSACHEPGIFQLDVPGVGRSPRFEIGSGAFTNAYRTAMLGMYLWRCGTAVSATFGGKLFAHDACHTNDAWLELAGGEHSVRPSLGGWHDAGDYNKYVVNAGVSVGVMLRAWEDFGGALEKVKLQLPPGDEGIPDFLREVKWELDWLLTMLAPDGSVYHKVSTRDFGAFIMPEEETAPRYFVPWGSAATADFVAMMAMAARDYEKYDLAFAARCLQAAQKSYQFLAENPMNHPADQSEFSTGTYAVRDRDARLWAAAELWETTGDAGCLRDYEERAKKSGGELDASWDYGNVKNLGELTYLFSTRGGRDTNLLTTLQTSLLKTADAIVAKAAAHGYARPLGIKYSWGGNGTVARQVVVLHAAEKISPKPAYRATAMDAVNYLLGRNSFGRSFVTGIGFEPPLHPHDRFSAALDLDVPCPGHLVGGPQPGALDWQDLQRDYTRNEIAVNWNTALIYALAEFLPEPVTAATAPAKIAANQK
ncbi:MAG: glycoside hydrolase family 9 protein [Verrucomicrobiota bacterium]